MDDNPKLLSSLVASLESLGFAVRTARSLEIAIHAVFSWGPFDAVICNHDLPDGNGMILLQCLREQVITIPFVLIAGRRPVAVPQSSRVKFLAKPFRPEQLRNVLDRILPGGLPEAASSSRTSAAAWP